MSQQLWVGLGNPEPGMAANRHNIGFMALDVIATRHGFSPWRRRFKGVTAEGTIAGTKILALKPLTYMEHGFSPATLRRGVVLSRLLGEANPFPIIRIPWDDHLKSPRPQGAASPAPMPSRAAAGALSEEALHAYTALAGVLVGALASTPEQLGARR